MGKTHYCLLCDLTPAQVHYYSSYYNCDETYDELEPSIHIFDEHEGSVSRHGNYSFGHHESTQDSQYDPCNESAYSHSTDFHCQLYHSSSNEPIYFLVSNIIFTRDLGFGFWLDKTLPSP